jgi:hypothetical protein
MIAMIALVVALAVYPRIALAGSMGNEESGGSFCSSAVNSFWMSRRSALSVVSSNSFL